MTFEQLKNRVPDYAKDVRMNVGSLTTISSLTQQQLWGTVVACAIATRNSDVLAAAVIEATPHLSNEAMDAAKTAGLLMAMNNVYYRFTHLVGKDYSKLPARLRMNAMGNPGVDKLDFELWSLGVSAINGCGMCMESHEQQVTANGAIGKEAVQDVVRIAAILQSLAVTLETEATLGQSYTQAAA